MRTFLSQYLPGILMPVIFVFGPLAQTPAVETDLDDRYAAAVRWVQYKVPTQNLSIGMPKLPVVRGADDLCSQTEGAYYTAYADHVVYQFGWHARSDKPFPKECRVTQRFGQKQYRTKVEEFRTFKSAVESDVKLMASPARMFRSEFENYVTTHWILWDIDRWFEITIHRRKDSNLGEDRFLNSISIPDSGAVEIGAGSLRILGDRTTHDQKPTDSHKGPISEGIIITSKPRPAYTDEARSRNTQGTVVLRVTFLRNGGVGPITVVKGLEYGLTEQAISAAGRISFLPARANGSQQTVVKQVEYTFSIY